MRASPTPVPHIHRIDAMPRGPNQPPVASVAGRSPDRARLRANRRDGPWWERGGRASGFELAFKADALWVGTSIDGRRRTRWEFGGDRGGGDPVPDEAGGRAGLHARRPVVAEAERPRSDCGTTVGMPRPAPAWTSAAAS